MVIINYFNIVLLNYYALIINTIIIIIIIVTPLVSVTIMHVNGYQNSKHLISLVPLYSSQIDLF